MNRICLLAIVFVTTLLTACSSDDDTIDPVKDASGKTLVVYFSKTVPDGVDATTGATNVFAYNG